MENLAAFAVYDSCAEWCAKRGLKGKIGDPLPNLLSAEVHELINGDPEAFEQRVKESAYALAMERMLQRLARERAQRIRTARLAQ